MRFLHLIPFTCFAALAAAVFPLNVYSQEEADSAIEELPDPYEWVTQSYSFPASSLIWGFASEKRGELRAPSMPGEEATDEEVQNFIKKSNSVVSHYLEQEGFALPEGVLVLYDPESNTLTARAPRIVQGSLSFVSEDFQASSEKYILIEVESLEGVTEAVQEMAGRAGEMADHPDLRNELAGAEGTRLIDSGLGEVRSGQRAKIGSGEEVYQASDLFLFEGGAVEYVNDGRDVGTVWEFDTVLGADEVTIDLNLGLTHDITPPARKMIEFTRSEGGTISSAASETHFASIISQYTMRSGTSKLLGIWNPDPVGADEGGVRQAAFVTATAIKNLPVLEKRLEEILEQHGEAILPIPEGDLKFEKEAEEIPEGMIVRRFVIPPTFLSSGGGGGGESAADPFADPIRNEPRFTVRVTAKTILQSAGISFPPGSSANYLPSSSLLVVRNTPENIQLVEAYVMSICESVEKSIGATIHVVEGPAEVIREIRSQTRGLTNHEDQWDELLAHDEVTLLDTIWMEGRSGQRSKVESGKEFVFPVGVAIEREVPKDKEDDAEQAETRLLYAEPSLETQVIGTMLEMDPVLGADEWTIDINFALHYDYAPPEHEAAPQVGDGDDVRMEGPTTKFHQAKLSTQTVFRSGSIRMMGYWAPEGAPQFADGDIMQAAFLKLEVVRPDEEEYAR